MTNKPDSNLDIGKECKHEYKDFGHPNGVKCDNCLTNKPTWADEFDKEFPNTKFTMDFQYIKNFISTKLAEQREELIEKTAGTIGMVINGRLSKETGYDHLVSKLTDFSTKKNDNN